MRLDPHNPARYLIYLGLAHFCMGELKEAMVLVEKGMRLNPELSGAATWIAAYCGLLDREKEARAAVDTLIKAFGKLATMEEIRYFFPFKDRAVADQFVEGLLKGGYWPGKISGEYFHPQKENQLTGEEIKKLLFGSKITAINPYGQQWWYDWKKNGEFTCRGPGPISSDTGMSRVEGDMICSQGKKQLWGLEYCQTVFRNARGTKDGKDEYFFMSDIGFAHFSLVR
jgi:hypothetical protein